MLRFIVVNVIWIAMIVSGVLSAKMLFPDWSTTTDLVSVILYFTLSGLLAAAVTDIVDRWFFKKK